MKKCFWHLIVRTDTRHLGQRALYKCTDLIVCFLSQVAIKSIRKERITDDLDRIHIQREIEITASLRHSNIIRFHEGESAKTVHVSLWYWESSALTYLGHFGYETFTGEEFCHRESQRGRSLSRTAIFRTTTSGFMQIHTAQWCTLVKLPALSLFVSPFPWLQNKSSRCLSKKGTGTNIHLNTAS